MCGILGYSSVGKPTEEFMGRIAELFVLTQSRGSHASGVAWEKSGGLLSGKAPMPATQFIESETYREMEADRPRMMIAHTRWATTGHQSDNANNHPHVGVRGDEALIHNGVIWNWESLRNWHGLKYRSGCDSEVILRMYEHFLGRGRSDAARERAIKKACSRIIGSASFALLNAGTRKIYLGRHSNPVHIVTPQGSGAVVFASEAGHLEKAFPGEKVLMLIEDRVMVISGNGWGSFTVSFRKYRPKPFTPAETRGWTLEDVSTPRRRYLTDSSAVAYGGDSSQMDWHTLEAGEMEGELGLVWPGD